MRYVLYGGISFNVIYYCDQVNNSENIKSKKPLNIYNICIINFKRNREVL